MGGEYLDQYKTTEFKRVVIVEFPRAGMKVISFVTGGIKCKDGIELTSIFIPTTPNPISPVISLVYPDV
jgi:uncharacterized membrane protein